MKKNSFVKTMAFVLVGAMAVTPVSVMAGHRKPTRIDGISATKKTVFVGEEFELEVYNSERNVDDDYFVWSTSNKKVVRLDDDDNRDDEMEFIAVNPGTAKITCEIKGTNIKKTCVVTVKERNTEAYIDVDDDGKGYITVEIGDDEDIDATLRNANGSNRQLVYKSLTPSIVSVNRYGEVFGKKIGTGKVQISSKADPSIKTVVEVRVEWDD
ncbi:MAG: hypothetical protein IAC13_07650 [Firmicutes bacterium]|uniref:BIG2 domain-containing protein n=1 Tax=Candidatus Scybalomonas excrementavium TaxID=2840943 RepID=A0A9D9N7X0_9FIRM|nr:hypothetical protein [Candidatus Scybalomonas excrementavium]